MNPQLAELIALRTTAREGRPGAQRAVMSLAHGEFRAPTQLLGRGLEFVESRPYASGDDARSIDWRVTARQGKPHTKLYAAERERPLWLVADFTSSMEFGSRVRFKSAQAARIAAWLAWAGRAAGNRLGGLRVDDEQLTMTPAVAGDRGVLAWLEVLSRPSPPGRRAPAAGQLAAALTTLQARLRAGDRLIVISDFYALDDVAAASQLEMALVAVAERAELSLLRVTDPLESSPPESGDYPVWVNNKTVWMNTGVPAMQARWRTLFAERSARLLALARQHGWRLAELATDDDVAATMPRVGVV